MRTEFEKGACIGPSSKEEKEAEKENLKRELK